MTRSNAEIAAQCNELADYLVDEGWGEERNWQVVPKLREAANALLSSSRDSVEAAAHRSGMIPGPKEAKGSNKIDWSKTDGQEL